MNWASSLHDGFSVFWNNLIVAGSKEFLHVNVVQAYLLSQNLKEEVLSVFSLTTLAEAAPCLTLLGSVLIEAVVTTL